MSHAVAPFDDPGAVEGAGAVRAGIASMLPLVVAYIPFALVIGTVLSDHGSLPLGLVGTWTIFGGSAHLATVRTFAGAGAVAAILTGLLVNARLLVYSAGLARHWRDQPAWYRLAAAALVIDPTWAAAEQHASEAPDPATQRRRFLAAGITLGVGFSATVAVGMLLGSRLPTSELSIAVPLCLLSMIGPALRRRRDLRVVVVAAAVAVVAGGLPWGTGLLLATAAGCAVAGGGTEEAS